MHLAKRTLEMKEMGARIAELDLMTRDAASVALSRAKALQATMSPVEKAHMNKVCIYIIFSCFCFSLGKKRKPSL